MNASAIARTPPWQPFFVNGGGGSHASNAPNRIGRGSDKLRPSWMLVTDIRAGKDRFQLSGAFTSAPEQVGNSICTEARLFSIAQLREGKVVRLSEMSSRTCSHASERCCLDVDGWGQECGAQPRRLEVRCHDKDWRLRFDPIKPRVSLDPASEEKDASPPQDVLSCLSVSGSVEFEGHTQVIDGSAMVRCVAGRSTDSLLIGCHRILVRLDDDSEIIVVWDQMRSGHANPVHAIQIDSVGARNFLTSRAFQMRTTGFISQEVGERVDGSSWVIRIPKLQLHLRIQRMMVAEPTFSRGASHGNLPTSVLSAFGDRAGKKVVGQGFLQLPPCDGCGFEL